MAMPLTVDLARAVHRRLSFPHRGVCHASQLIHLGPLRELSL
jgi:hypothetical protein